MAWRSKIADMIELGLAATKMIFGSGRFYRPFTEMVWHPIYSDNTLTTAQRRADRDAELPSEWTGEVWYTCKKYWKGKCAACGATKSIQRDHIVPVAYMWCPGAVPSNLLPLCKKCNQDKFSTDLATWYRRIYGNPTKLVEKVWDWQELCFKRGWN